MYSAKKIDRYRVILPVTLLGRLSPVSLGLIAPLTGLNKDSITASLYHTGPVSERKGNCSSIHQLRHTHTHQQTLIHIMMKGDAERLHKFEIKCNITPLIDMSDLCHLMLPRENQQEMGHILQQAPCLHFSTICWASSSSFICHMRGYPLQISK